MSHVARFDDGHSLARPDTLAAPFNPQDDLHADVIAIQRHKECCFFSLPGCGVHTLIMEYSYWYDEAKSPAIGSGRIQKSQCKEKHLISEQINNEVMKEVGPNSFG